MNENPGFNLEEHFRTNSRQRLFNDFLLYLKVLIHSNEYPVLTLNTIYQLATRNTDKTIDFLSNFSDNDIINLVGKNNKIHLLPLRPLLIVEASLVLINTRCFLLTTNEAKICSNTHSVALEKFDDLGHAFLAKGVILSKLVAYDIITDLFENFDSNKGEDGTITFLDPTSRDNKVFTVDDLKYFRSAVASERAGIKSSKPILDRFDEYIRQAEMQNSSTFEAIKIFRKYEDKDAIRNVFISYFHMGMYMRRWRGHDHKYPIREGETGPSVHGLDDANVITSQNVTEAKNVFLENLKILPDDLQGHFWNLKMYFSSGQGLIDKGKSIGVIWDEVITTYKFCIRMASGQWAYTGAYYLKQILKEDINGFDINRGLDHVS